MRADDVSLGDSQHRTQMGAGPADGGPVVPPGSPTAQRILPLSSLIAPEMISNLHLGEQAIETIIRSVPGGAHNVQEIYPLSPVQEGVLFHHMLNERAGTYVLSALFELQSHSHLQRFITGLQAVIDRHDTLRTAVVWERLPRPVQVVYRHADLPIEEVRLDPARDSIDQLTDYMRRGIDVRQAPLMRLQIASNPHGDSYYAVLQRHHIVFDHQSWNLVFAEVIACMEGREPQLPPPRPYREYVGWSLENMAKREVEDFFRRRLGDVDESTAPFGVTDVHEDGDEIEEASAALNVALSRRLRTQAERLQMSPARLVHVAWALVVASTSGRDDIVLGSVLSVSQRRVVQARARPGLFVNTLPLRLSIGKVTVKELAEQVDRELTAVSQFQEAPLSLIQKCAGTGASPLFTAVLNYRHSAGHSVLDQQPKQACALGLRVLAQRYRTNYPITLVVDDFGLGFSLTALTDRRIDANRVLRYAQVAIGQVVVALERGIETPARALSILPPGERRQITEDFNATKVVTPKHKLIHELFEEQVQRTPDLSAVLHNDSLLTYADLNARANTLARALRGRGVGPDQLVGICMDRSIDMLVGLLAILKAGAAYVPLDPSYPIERLRYMVEDAAPLLVVTQSGLKRLLPVSTDLLEIDAAVDPDQREAQNVPAAQLGLTKDNLLYVIYTSGSTGRPKGVAMTHGSMSNLIQWHRDNLPLQPGARVLQFAALSFDVAFQEIFSTLCLGGTLVLLKEAARKDAYTLTLVLNARSVERLFLPPLMLQAIAESAQSTGVLPGTLKDIIAAGEQLRVTPEIVDLFNDLDACRLHNHYGPTETHVVTALTLSGDASSWPPLPSIGRPIANTMIYILDRRGEPIPLGVEGEIHIGGANVARGYLHRPELTAERFVPDPFSGGSKARLYRTGDSGRWRPDGTIEYLGRNDDQVKVRGYRIELGEVEAQFALYEHVKDVVVVVREVAAGDRRLVAYVTARNGQYLNPDALRAHVKARLPGYMVPSAIMVLKQFPATANGKLDRRSLPEPEAAAYHVEQYEAPAGELEKVIAGIWCMLLRVDRVGRYDSFFELGGHSLLATRLASHISQALDVDLPLQVIFERPTIQGLAEAIVQEVTKGSATEAP